MNDKQFIRIEEEKMFLGVANGLAHYFNIDPVFVRLFFVLATLAGSGLGIILYIILAFIMPTEVAPEASIIEDEEIVIKGI